MRRWHVAFGVGAIVAVLLLSRVLHADSHDDLSRAKSDHDSLKSHLDDVRGKVNDYLDESVKLRKMDAEELAQLIDLLCRSDVEYDDDAVDKLNQGLRDAAIDRVKAVYTQTIADADHMLDQLGHLMDDAKLLRDRVHDLKDKDEIKDDASRLADDIDATIDSIDRLSKKVQADKNTLSNVQAGVMRGSNNPTIRARMDYGKEQHKKLQDSFSCEEREVVLSSGRPDCIKFDAGECKVIEFKPDTNSTDDAVTQANRYLSDVRQKYKDDDRAKKCKQTDDGPEFKSVGVTYPACRAP